MRRLCGLVSNYFDHLLIFGNKYTTVACTKTISSFKRKLAISGALSANDSDFWRIASFRVVLCRVLTKHFIGAHVYPVRNGASFVTHNHGTGGGNTVENKGYTKQWQWKNVKITSHPVGLEHCGERVRMSVCLSVCVGLYDRISQQELIRRWDSERELLYDDNIHLEASAYAHWTDLLISTINIYGRPNLCT